MKKGLEIGLIISAYDKASRVINDVTGNASRKLSELEKRSKKANESMLAGTATIAAGAGIVASLTPAIQAYEDLEDASATLRSTMLKEGGVVSKNFETINAISEKLGNQLPGTTRDFQAMMVALLRGGVAEESIINGVGKSAAYLGTVLKIPYEQAAEMAAKLKIATGTADDEMLAFMDTIQRTVNVGVKTDEMQYAFARSAGSLKLLNIQGLEASKSIAAVYASLIQSGQSGETVGTNMSTLMESFLSEKKVAKLNDAAAKYGLVLDFVDKKSGQFKGVENMVAQFDKMKDLNPTQRTELTTALTGSGTDGRFMNLLIDGGTARYNQITREMAAQATLNQKVAEQLKTLKAVKEAAAGTYENMLAAMGESIGPELKMLASGFNKVSELIQGFAKSHPRLFKIVGLFIAFVGVATMVVGAFMLIKGAVIALTIALMANPIVLIIAAVALAAIAIYANWDRIVPFFKNLWTQVKAIFKSAVDMIFGKDQFLKAGASIPKMIANGLMSAATLPVRAMAGIVKKMREYLPFSPAKEGPFKDLHRVKIVETIASSMKSGPLVKAMQRTTGDAMNAANGNAGGRSLNARAGAGGGNTTIHVSPVFNISGASGPGLKSDLNNASYELKRLVMQCIDEAGKRGARVGFSS